MLIPLLLLVSAVPPDLAAVATDVADRARAHHEAREFVEAANAYLVLSALPGADVDDALNQAHLELEAAFAATTSPLHLCRALNLARGRLARGKLEDKQVRLAWEETVTDDLERLADVGGEGVCPRPARRARVVAANTPRPKVPQAHAPAPLPEVAITTKPAADRRQRARSAAGFTLTGLGLGLSGLMGVTLGLYRTGYAAIREAGDVPDGFVYSDEEQAKLGELRRDTLLARGAAIGLGAASAVTLATGIGLLVSHRRAARKMAILPSKMPRGGGLALRLRF